jgi:CHASE3 domain sensor protein
MLTSDNQSQQYRIARLTTLVGQEIQVAGQIVQLRRTAGEQVASARMAEDDDIQLIEKIRNLLHDMQQEETRLLAARQVTADRAFGWVALMMALGIFCAIVVLAVAGWLVVTPQRHVLSTSVGRSPLGAAGHAIGEPSRI